MRNILENLKKFHKDENGDVVQTGIIIGILAVIAAGGLLLLSPKIKQLFDNAGGALDNSNITY